MADEPDIPAVFEGKGSTGSAKDQSTANAEVSSERPFECPICLQAYNLPVEIPCGHSFCFLCIKGVCARNSRCPLCRQTVPADYFYEPKILSPGIAIAAGQDSTPTITEDDEPPDSPTKNLERKPCCEDVDCAAASTSKSSIRTSPVVWLYEGRNGWWRYDDRTLATLEDAYAKDPNAATVECMISGFVYVVDFRRMVQFRKDEPSRRRRVRRDSLDDGSDVMQAAVKGIAGIKLPNAPEALTRKKSES